MTAPSRPVGEASVADDDDRCVLEPFPRRVVLGLSLCVMVLLLALARRYGWHRDELYFLEAGKHLAWGYVDQPPFTPAVARLAHQIAPDNLVVLRALPALATAVTIALGAGIVRELGGSTRAQTVGAAAVSAGGFVLGVGHLLSTATFDLTAWMALLWVTARLLRTGDQRWWLAFGGIAGASMLNKNLIVLLGGSLLAGLVVERRWDLLVSPWLAVGAILAVAIASPNLVWQAHHGWPQAEMAQALSRRLAAENRVILVPSQVLLTGPALIGVIVAGARWLARAPRGRPYRVLLWAWPASLIAAFATGGRPYYAVPITLVILLAGLPAGDTRPRLRRITGLATINALVSLPLALPILPPTSAALATPVTEPLAETIGWPQLAAQIADVVDDLPPEDQQSAVLLAASYGEAGAVDRFGPAHGLQSAFSPHNSYADFRQPTDNDAVVVAVRFTPEDLRPYFHRCTQVATVHNGLDIDNEVQGAPILVCRELKHDWNRTWAQLRFLS